MPICYRNSLLATLLCLCVGTATAMSSISDGDLVITLRNGTLCYSYPHDAYTKREAYYFGDLSVSWNDREASLPPKDSWEAQSGKDVVSPSIPEMCLEYGVVQPGASQKSPAKPHRSNVPYRAHLSVYSSNSTKPRQYLAYYCLSRNKAGEPIIQKAEYSDKTQRYECVVKSDGGW